MARIFITGSASGLGQLAAQTLLAAGHEVVVHARSADRLQTDGPAVIGDLADAQQARDVAAQVNRLGALDAVIHNAGVYLWYHQQRRTPPRATLDPRFQDELLATLADVTGTPLP